MTQRMASTMLDLPQPLGPTMAVIGSGKLIDVRSTNDLNPQMSMRLIFNPPSGESKFEVTRHTVTVRHLYGHGSPA
jgi:hypothetical protein